MWNSSHIHNVEHFHFDGNNKQTLGQIQRRSWCVAKESESDQTCERHNWWFNLTDKSSFSKAINQPKLSRQSILSALNCNYRPWSHELRYSCARCCCCCCDAIASAVPTSTGAELTIISIEWKEVNATTQLTCYSFSSLLKNFFKLHTILHCRAI